MQTLTEKQNIGLIGHKFCFLVACTRF